MKIKLGSKIGMTFNRAARRLRREGRGGRTAVIEAKRARRRGQRRRPGDGYRRLDGRRRSDRGARRRRPERVRQGRPVRSGRHEGRQQLDCWTSSLDEPRRPADRRTAPAPRHPACGCPHQEATARERAPVRPEPRPPPTTASTERSAARVGAPPAVPSGPSCSGSSAGMLSDTSRARTEVSEREAPSWLSRSPRSTPQRVRRCSATTR